MTWTWALCSLYLFVAMLTHAHMLHTMRKRYPSERGSNRAAAVLLGVFWPIVIVILWTYSFFWVIDGAKTEDEDEET